MAKEGFIKNPILIKAMAKSKHLSFMILALAIVGIVLISGCIQESPKTQISQSPEKETPPQVQPEQPQQASSLQPPPECIGRTATSPDLPESCRIWFSMQKTQQPQQQVQQPIQANEISAEAISVKAIDSEYKIITARPAGWFKTGQDADIMLSGIDFNDAGGPLLFNHPGTVATDGTHLLLADRNNNRVLIWNKLPTGNTPPDLVLGQKDFTSNNPGTELDQMNWPVSVAADGGKVVVTDTSNNRILIWNTFPAQHGQPADIVINTGPGGQNVEKKRSVVWPWGVWTDGKKLAISSTSNGVVLLWNTFPAQNDQPADLYLTASGKMGTPRTITSDGDHLIVGDHNAKTGAQANAMTYGGSQGNFFWRKWPTQNDEPYSFFMSDPTDPMGAWMQGDFTSDGKLIMLGVTLHIWDSFPENADDKPDISVGSSGPDGPSKPDISVESSGPDGPSGPSDTGYKFFGGDGSGLAAVGDSLYISLSNGNKIVGFNSIPSSPSKKPDFAIGAPDIYTNTLDTNFIMSNPVPVTDGRSLFISSDFDDRLYVYKNLPDESGAHPDFVYQGAGGWDNELFGNKLAVAGQNRVMIWNTLPRNGGKPDIIFKNSIGKVRFQELKGVAMDDKYFYLADNPANKVYVWEGIPRSDSDPLFSLNIQGPWRLSSAGKYLAVTRIFNHQIELYSVDTLSANSKPTASVGGPGEFNLPQHGVISQGHLFVGDTGFNRLHIWKQISDAIAGKPADVILGETSPTIAQDQARPEIGKNKLFMPAIPAFDGSYLWVGEFKFSERLLRFSVK